MNTATAQARTQHRELSAAEAFVAIEAHRICLIPGFDGKVWQASSLVYGEKHNSKRPIRDVSALADTCLSAVSRLVAELEEENNL